jgi:hypothetical protein
MKNRLFLLLICTLFFISPLAHSQSNADGGGFNYKPGICYVYEMTRRGISSVFTECVREINGDLVTLSNGSSFDRRNRNYTKWQKNITYVERDGALTFKEACIPSVTRCDSLVALNAAPEEWSADGRYAIDSTTGGWFTWQTFSLKSTISDCNVLGKQERCLNGVRQGDLQLRNGIERNQDISEVVLTGDYRGTLLRFQNINLGDATGGHVRQLVAVEDRSITKVEAVQVGEVQAVPWIDSKGQSAWKQWINRARSPRAFIVAIDGTWTYDAGSDALEKALKRCASLTSAVCEPFAVDDKVVFRK